MIIALTSNETKSLKDAVYHRFIKFEADMNLVMLSDMKPGIFKAVDAGKGSDTAVPITYLNSLEHIDKPVFVPDFNHNATIDLALAQAYGSEYRFERHECKVWNETGWRIISDKDCLTDVYSTKASALLFCLCLVPPF